MPNPKDFDNKKDFINACIPQVLEEGTAKDEDQAVAICNDMWDKKEKKMKPKLFDEKNREERYLPSTLKIEKRDDGKQRITGYAAVFDKWSEDLGGFREKVAPGAFKAALKQSDARALFNHNSNFILGRQSAKTLELKEDKTGLYMEIDPPATSYAQDLMVSIRRGDISEQSFGFTIKADKWEDLDESSKIASRTILEVDRLYDVSPVTFAAYPDTNVAVRSLEAAKKELNQPQFDTVTVSDMLRSYCKKIDEGKGIEEITASIRRCVFELIRNINDISIGDKTIDEFFTILRSTFGEPTQADPANENKGEPTQANDKGSGDFDQEKYDEAMKP